MTFSEEKILTDKERDNPRLPIKIRVDFTSDDSVQTVSALNISAGGLFLATRFPLPAGSMVLLQLNLPSLEGAVEVMGEVVWNNVNRPGHSDVPQGMGIRFISQSSLVREYLGTFQSARSGNS